ncbi:MAG: ribosomal RNA small subunit methyltransferase A [Bdellovibrio sp. CG12_big_fil_rev_8_21_14_0_65_39_13]|nr:MAG: ribosomal RNA small subunit methyltransferase A [Bdellovibrio sp. CG22_combo_CG10-13_8_21_14_all_39_27]PIQ58956.1 MAG: ribosomal RNA small subunit methyltransferase A [Bdellovibrio sp. CG12_big_fil_rev_8_21_14_0_65_39_13]PIR33924.1 MAG: ribosomal RNA small subunit methyltransferase A [Bdellovibrio sp. CG11_big_fil_rev_8_21_14_0_20_39_38]PJB52267.1 MAG: ribosomal RNA small subunit methyltransferase A [Bdellovibrio sp. CG_4_9_14_3_um_filter_39_7]
MKHQVSANKSLGQHFLRDQEVIFSITENFKDQADAIIEVGPGPAVLTPALASLNLPFHVIEKDDRFPELLAKYLPKDHIHLQDALEINYDEFIKATFPQAKSLWLVSNLPYNVGTPLSILFLRCPAIKYMSLMYQKEVGEKIYSFAQKQKNAANSLGTLVLTYFDVKLLIKVPPMAFEPPPKVDSVVLSFVRLENPAIAYEQLDSFEKFLRTLFAQNRKQMGNFLRSSFSPEKLQAAFSAIDVPLTARAETLTLEQVQELYKLLSVKE